MPTDDPIDARWRFHDASTWRRISEEKEVIGDGSTANPWRIRPVNVPSTVTNQTSITITTSSATTEIGGQKMPDPKEAQAELQIAVPALTSEQAAEATLMAGFLAENRAGFRAFLRELKEGRRRPAYAFTDMMAWQPYCRALSKVQFAELVAVVTKIQIATCPHCGDIVSRLHVVTKKGADKEILRCETCIARFYYLCSGPCKEYKGRKNIHWEHVNGLGTVCAECIDQLYRVQATLFRCANCQIYVLNGQHGARPGYCKQCAPPDRSKCISRGRLDFEFPALNLESKAIAADQIVAITVGGGEISRTGLRAIQTHIYNETGAKKYGHGIFLDELGDGARNAFDAAWQTKEGNFPKRIAKLLLTTRSIKVTEGMMTEIGNIAKKYTTQPATHNISFTRDINHPAHQFANDASCWWGGSWHSRCDFKWHGGIAVRTFKGLDAKSGILSRMWMLPMKLTNKDKVEAQGVIPRLAPDIEMPADAYFCFNPYGIELLPYARLIAAMTGKSYKAIDARGTLYVNGKHGAVVAEQSICDRLEEVNHGRLEPDNCGCGAGGRLA